MAPQGSITGLFKFAVCIKHIPGIRFHAVVANLAGADVDNVALIIAVAQYDCAALSGFSLTLRAERRGNRSDAANVCRRPVAGVGGGGPVAFNDSPFCGLINFTRYALDGAANHLVEGQRLLDGNCATGEFAASRSMGDIAEYFNLGKTMICRLVVIKDIKRIFAGVKT
ncbi:hypothetical protein SGGMMB4_02250 [Sodalis glossinidius str. 'morsitans']|uniref:Uncharacterized protein n=1 Tax=Sodalis glossinidius (strain morsitans) TaxID=343509 RepID=A0A193QI70_SODGM|nr:hypothetical protein [Sodalis glossinidius]CRL44877.1 hypothetical protein SGGMMB4_02250 [Sodalis glossinidius str. 'morsitans']